MSLSIAVQWTTSPQPRPARFRTAPTLFIASRVGADSDLSGQVHGVAGTHRARERRRAPLNRGCREILNGSGGRRGSRQRKNRSRKSRHCSPSPLSVDDFSFAHAPQVAGMDVAVALADSNPAPAVVALVDMTDDARFGRVSHLGAVVGIGAKLARRTGLDDSGPPVAEQGHEHPALRAVRVLDQPPRLV